MELRAENRRLKRANARKVLEKDLAEKGREVPAEEFCQVRTAMHIMDETITNALEKGGAIEEKEIWVLHRDRLDQIYDNGGADRGKKTVRIHPTLMQWAIAFLARTSETVYNEVRKVMPGLPHISHTYRETAKLISTMGDKAYFCNWDTIATMAERAEREGWTEHQRRGGLAQDSANMNAGFQHDFVTNTLVGGDESHRLGNLTHMFQVMAQQVRDASDDEEGDEMDGQRVSNNMSHFSS